MIIRRSTVWHQFLPILPFEMAGSLFCAGIPEWSDDGLRQAVLTPLHALLSLRPCPLQMGFLFITALGKAEGQGTEWHGHVTALSVAPEYRRISLGRKLMNELERVSEEIYRGFFVDLYVRCTNNVAIAMYEGLGYSVYRRVREYYGSLGMGRNAKDEEDAFGAYSEFAHHAS